MKLTKRRIILSTVFLVAVFSLVFVSSAYVNGQAVVSNPKVTWVSHTEYWSGDDVSTIVRLTDYLGRPYQDIVGCRVTIMYPDKTVWVSDALMGESTVAGNYYHIEVAPYTQGTYEQEVRCTYGAGEVITTSQSFHVNPALTRIQNISADLISQTALLTDVHTSITAQITDTNQSVNTNIDESETTITTLINTVDTDLTNQMTTLGVDVDTKLTDVNESISAQLSDTQISIEANLGSTETTLSNLMTTLNSDLQSYLTEYLDELNTTLNAVYTDTQWISTNAMNQDNAAAIDARFDTVDNNLALIEDFCSNPQTSGSDLCVEIDQLRVVVDTMRTEQTTYYNDLDTTTTSTWDLLSGSVSTNIDTLLVDVGVIGTQTTEINETLAQIRTEQVERINMQVIS
ncbi:hypothetical protein HOD83_01270 [Candidatus Woesearchaeota archaeon]|jgi:hypothetical protein|nr:hypothetical protein [Candidatus Woesearchaeota archaeon]MBT4248201.1 hypothetical protein [Candidatus Woesearchaeota archaeon]